MVTHSRRTLRPKAFGRGTRAAVALIAMGAFLLSSGLVIVTQGGASAAALKVAVCHATGSDTGGNQHNGYDLIHPSAAGVKSAGHLMHRDAPNETWKSAGTWNGIPHLAGDTKRDYIADFASEPHALDGTNAAVEALCAAATVPARIVVPDVHWIEPDCATAAGFTGDDPADITYTVTAGVPGNGTTVTVTATAHPGFLFNVGGKASTTEDFTHTFTSFDPRLCAAGKTVVTPDVNFTNPTCLVPANGTWTGVDPAAHPGSVSYVVTTGSTASGDTIVVTATALAGFAFDAAGTTVRTFSHLFPAATGCGGPAAGPTVVTPDVAFTNPTCASPASGTSVPVDPSAHPGSVNYVTTSGSTAAGDTIVVTATALAGFAFDAAGTTVQTFSHSFPAATGCGGGVTLPPTAVATKAPSFTDATCSAPNTVALKLPGTVGTAAGGALATSVLDGVTYTATGTLKPGHTVMVTAVPGASQVLTAGSVTQWKHTFAKASHCGTKHQPSTHHGQKGEHAAHHAHEAAQAPSSVVVPTNVDAGLIDQAGPVATPSLLTQLRTLGVVLVLAGGLLLLGGGSWLGLGRRRRGALV